MDFKSTLKEYLVNYCEGKNISIDMRFRWYGDDNKFYSYDTPFSLDVNEYYTDDLEDIKQFFAVYLDTLWEHCTSPMNRIALYVQDIVDMDGWYNVIIGGGLFIDDTLL